MSNVPENLRYTKNHEWVRAEGETTLIYGITDYAQDQLGDITYVEVPDVGAELSAGDSCGVVESVKTFSDIYAPVEGEVSEVNEGLDDAPEVINSDPYGEGWIAKIAVADLSGLDELMDAAAYQALLATLG